MCEKIKNIKENETRKYQQISGTKMSKYGIYVTANEVL